MTFEQENDALLQCLLEERFFKVWKEHCTNEDRSLWPETSLELYITSTCNQHCEYCYLVKYPQLYPTEFNKPEIIKHNLKLIYDWIIKNDFSIPRIDFFSGEIWGSQLGWDVFDITLDALRKGMKVPYFLIPSNCSFCLDPRKVAKIQTYINEFTRVGSCLGFSISVDGKIVDNDTRAFNDSSLEKSDDYYERIFLFAEHNNFKFHPMVAASNISKWIENFQWWEQEINKYKTLSINDLMLLEVRNNNWSDQAINDYNKFMEFLINYDMNRCLATKDDLKVFVNALFNLSTKIQLTDSYLPYFPVTANTFMPCTISNQFTIRVGDLAIPPCHRTAYNKLLYGRFMVTNDELGPIVANNIYMAQKILFSNIKTTHFKCDACILNQHCLKGCAGEQWEENADPFMPSENVCHFFEEKWKFIVGYFYDLGIVAYCKKNFNPYHSHYPMVKRFIEFCERVNFAYGLGKN